ncbi:nucleolar protein 4-like isoform X1 [Felis catus]|uniref:nucleolar protein 4-like isoform X1 n=3 Tax=Felis catus TaxID=9685 RepID=UPI001D1A200F|nr:nucleolar protein 4-like isoform X1 [Felis catus]
MPKPTLLLRGGWERERSPGDSELGRQFRDWCLRTYGDSAKTKTVTRSKYQRIAEVLQGGGGTGAGSGPAAGEKGKFQFWVRSKGFRLGSGREPKMGQVVYVPVKTGSGADGLSEPEGISLKRVAVVEDFFDIIYSMHVESSAEPGKAPKHAGQKKTYRAIAETYAFLPREAVTRFLMSCTECQKRMHFNSNGLEPKENEPPSPLVSGIIDYNMPLTSTYLKQMKLRVMNSQEQDETSVSSEDFDMNDSTWMSADPHLASSLSPSQDERMRSPQNLHSQEDDDSSSESGSGNGSSTLNPSTSSSTQGDPAFPEMNGNGAVAPMDFTATSEDQPINLCDKLPPGAALGTPSYPSDGCGTDGLRSRVKYGVKTTPESPPYSSGSYDSIKTEVSGCPEDLTVGRAPTADDDDDDHDDHEDNDKMNDSEGMDPERLKAFNMFVRLFVDENLDRMVPISKQPKEKIQAIIESCSRQFPEFQERARKRIRTYLKSCRRMKKNGMEMTRPTPPHLTSAMAENILAAACESETRKAAKRMRLEIYQSSQDEPIALDKQHSRDSAAITHSTYSLPASSYSQDPVYVNGGLNYSYRGYGALGSNLQPPASLQTGNHSNGTEHLLRGRGILRLLGNRLSTHSTFLHVALRARHPAPARHHHHLPGLASTSPTATQGTRPSPPGQKSHPGLSTRTAPLWTPGLSTHPCLSGCRVPAARCLPSPGQPPGAGRNSTPLRRTQTLIAHGRSPRGSSASPQCREAGQFFALRPPPRPAARAGICAR